MTLRLRRGVPALPERPEDFWAEAAGLLAWTGLGPRARRLAGSVLPLVRGGAAHVCHNAVDRHVEPAGRSHGAHLDSRSPDRSPA